MDGRLMNGQVMKVARADGSVFRTDAIACNRDHVGNLIAEGDLCPSEREDALVRLYEGQLMASAREICQLQQKIESLTERLGALESA